VYLSRDLTRTKCFSCRITVRGGVRAGMRVLMRVKSL
jgi:hypothetical protein